MWFRYIKNTYYYETTVTSMTIANITMGTLTNITTNTKSHWELMQEHIYKCIETTEQLQNYTEVTNIIDNY